MGYGIVKQPNELYAVWSTIIDSFICFDCTREDLVDWYTNRYRESITTDIERRCNDIDKDNKRYCDKDKWQDKLDDVLEIHGDEEYNELICWIEDNTTLGLCSSLVTKPGS